jgi:hypothetical protein
VISGLVIVFLVMDTGMKIAALPIVSASAANIGWTAGLWLRDACCRSAE